MSGQFKIIMIVLNDRIRNQTYNKRSHDKEEKQRKSKEKKGFNHPSIR